MGRECSRHGSGQPRLKRGDACFRRLQAGEAATHARAPRCARQAGAQAPLASQPWGQLSLIANSRTPFTLTHRVT